MGSVATVTSPRGLETVEQVDPLDVVGQRGIGHQGAVPVNAGDCELERQLFHVHGLVFHSFKNPSCRSKRDA